MRTLDEVVRDLFERRVTGVNDDDFQTLWKKNKAMTEMLIANPRMQQFAREAAGAIIKEIATSHRVNGNTRDWPRILAEWAMANYGFGAILGREVQRDVEAAPRIIVQ